MLQPKFNVDYHFSRGGCIILFPSSNLRTIFALVCYGMMYGVFCLLLEDLLWHGGGCDFISLLK